MRVLFVCTANICRSAYAEVLARHVLGPGSGLAVASAGTYGLPAQPLNPDIGVHLPVGADPSGFASRRVTRADVEGADLVLAMEASHRRFLLDEFPAAFRRVFLLGQFAEAVADGGGEAGSAGAFGGSVASPESGVSASHAQGRESLLPPQVAPAPMRLRGRALLDAIAQQRPPARPQHDVADPYRRGPEANARAAAQIAGYLAVVLPALSEGPTERT
jgi:sulfate adenylyltransferase